MTQRHSRRHLLGVGAGLAAGLAAGCTGATLGGSDDSSSDEADDDGGNGESDVAPQPEPEGEMLDDFADLSIWTAISGNLSADEETYLQESQSARISVGEDDNRAVIARDFHPPIDLSLHRPQLAIKADAQIMPRLQVIDIHGNRIDFRTLVRANLDFQYFDFGIDHVDDDLELGAIEKIQLAVNISQDEPVDMWFDALRVTGRVSPGIVLIQFDDGMESEYTTAYPILEEHDMVASSFVNPGYLGRIVGGEQRLTVSELEEIHDAGWDVGNHGMYHRNLADLDQSEQEEEVNDAYTWLVDNGFERAADHFAYPFAVYDQKTLDLVAENHSYGFTAGWPALGRCANRYLLHRAASDPGVDEATDAIDQTVEHGGITTLYYHGIINDEEEEAFEEVIMYLDELRTDGALEVKTVSEVGSTFLDDSL